VLREDRLPHARFVAVLSTQLCLKPDGGIGLAISSVAASGDVLNVIRARFFPAVELLLLPYFSQILSPPTSCLFGATSFHMRNFLPFLAARTHLNRTVAPLFLPSSPSFLHDAKTAVEVLWTVMSRDGFNSGQTGLFSTSLRAGPFLPRTF